MTRALRTIAGGCLAAATLMGASAVTAYADYPGYGGGAMGPEDTWAKTHPDAGKMSTTTKGHVHSHMHAHHHHLSSDHTG